MFYRIISGLNFLCPKYKRKTEAGQTFTFRTIAEWNAFDPTIRKKLSIASFKRTLCETFLSDQKTSSRYEDSLYQDFKFQDVFAIF